MTVTGSWKIICFESERIEACLGRPWPLGGREALQDSQSSVLGTASWLISVCEQKVPEASCRA